jgi:hypothetical protein
MTHYQIVPACSSCCSRDGDEPVEYGPVDALDKANATGEDITSWQRFENFGIRDAHDLIAQKGRGPDRDFGVQFGK